MQLIFIRLVSLLMLVETGCAMNAPRMRLLFSDPVGAAWSFVLEDHGIAAQLLIDGRPRVDDCIRAGVTLRCELRGLFPGGHVLELRLAGGMLRRTVVLGSAWNPRPVFVRARDLATVAGAAHAGTDGVLLPQGMEPAAMEELVEAAHKGGIRVLLEVAQPGPEPMALLERLSLDGVIGMEIDRATARRFPAVRSWRLDASASQKLADHVKGKATALSELASGEGLVETHGALGLGLALLARRGAITDGAGFALLGIRKHHKALREGVPTTLIDDGVQRAVRIAAGGDALTLVTNAGSTPFAPHVELPPLPIDLLGGPMLPTGPTVPPGELAAILASPDPDHTRY